MAERSKVAGGYVKTRSSWAFITRSRAKDSGVESFAWQASQNADIPGLKRYGPSCKHLEA